MALFIGYGSDNPRNHHFEWILASTAVEFHGVEMNVKLIATILVAVQAECSRRSGVRVVNHFLRRNSPIVVCLRFSVFSGEFGGTCNAICFLVVRIREWFLVLVAVGRIEVHGLRCVAAGRLSIYMHFVCCGEDDFVCCGEDDSVCCGEDVNVAYLSQKH